MCAGNHNVLTHAPDAIPVARDCTQQEEDFEKSCEGCGAAKAVHSVAFQVRVVLQAPTDAAVPVTRPLW